MIWLLVVLVVVVVVVLAVLGWQDTTATSERASYQTMVDLHTIRRRSEVAQVKTELRRDAADTRRQLRGELNKLDNRE